MLNRIKVFVEDLQLGMYVSQLDRPWVDTPFLFQGFTLQNPNEIQELQKHCSFVYVDEELSRVKIAPKTFAPRPFQPKLVKPVASRIIAPKDFQSFRGEIKKAFVVHETTKKFISQAMYDTRLGKSVDVKQAKNLVSQLAENVVANPTALVWLTQLKNKDEYTSLHSLNVCILSLVFGRSLNLNQNQLKTLGLGALLHDIGKLKVPTEVLNKPGRLSDEEYNVMKKHTVYGYDLMKNQDELSNDSLDIIQQHHERPGGHGYPNGLGQHQINNLTKIVSIVDVYDAITSRRVYHNEITPYSALNEMYKKKEQDFDPHLVEQFIKCLGIYPIGSTVELTTGEVGVVAYFNEKHHLSPTILLILDANKKPYPQRRYLNLGSDVWDKQDQRPEIKKIIDPTDYNLNIANIVKDESLSLVFNNAV